MNQITEQLISDLGVKATNLSYKKIRLDYKIGLYSSNGELIENNIPITVRYRKTVNDMYSLIYPKDSFICKFTNKYKVKKKYFRYATLQVPLVIDGYNFESLIWKISIQNSDWYKVWKRDKILNSILNAQE